VRRRGVHDTAGSPVRPQPAGQRHHPSCSEAVIVEPADFSTAG
jgi:hypothetical protein